MGESELYWTQRTGRSCIPSFGRAFPRAWTGLKPLPGNRKVCELLVQALLDAEEYRSTVLGAISGEDEKRIRKRRQALFSPEVDADSR